MTPSQVSLDDIDSALVEATPRLTRDESDLAITVYQLLAAGEPVRIDAAAVEAGISSERARDILMSWPAVYFDREDRVAGFWGLALNEMPHRLLRAGVDLYAWCAWDPLFLAQIVGTLDVATDDPVSGDTITYQIAADGRVTHLSHPDTALSFLKPNRMWDDNVMATFCHYVLQFASSESAHSWTAKHPDTFTIRFDDAQELARRHFRRIAGGESTE
jgi:alkylmercury lyase